MALSCGLVSDPCFLSWFAFRITGQDQRTLCPLFSDTNPNVSAYVKHQPREIDTVSTMPKIHLRSEEKKHWLSMSEEHAAH